jgi:hypothetical protein
MLPNSRSLGLVFFVALVGAAACTSSTSALQPFDASAVERDGARSSQSDASVAADATPITDGGRAGDTATMDQRGEAAPFRDVSIVPDAPVPAVESGTDAATGSACVNLPDGERVVSIAGMWTFTAAGAAARTIMVPGGGWLAQGIRTTGGQYQTTVTIPDLGHPQATFVEFGAVNHQATLAVDGATVATQTTSFTPSVFDISRYAIPGRTQSLVVDVLGRDGLHDAASGRKLVPDAAGWSPNIAQGIFRAANIRVVPQVFIADVFVRPSVADDTITIDVSVGNSGTAAATASLSTSLASWNCDPWTYPALPDQQVMVPAGGRMTATIGPVKWGLGPSSYWWPNVPYEARRQSKLHYAIVSLNANGVTHSLPARFGFREMRQVASHYELNGVWVNLRGDNLQGANYDSIRIGAGPSDAYDRWAGFLPPSPDNAGWPQAVDNYQRLNYNVVRVHQEPASPYMLDTTDEMGLMVIDETAIRGTSGDQDFVAGLLNMVGHARALVLRDRNHPSVIRWSQSNEAEYDPTNSVAFQQQLFDTIVAADSTRPVSADSGFNGPGFDRSFTTLATATNFSVYPHYPGGGPGIYTETVLPSTTRPFGVGEYIWPKDNSAQGLAWFATATMAMRPQDASDLRPYTLLSGWASFVPGVARTTMTIEQGGNPLFGADNLSDPWSNPLFIRIQRAFHPVLVADIAYWAANRMSNASGAWPSSVPTVAHGATLSLQLLVFNDTFADTGVDVDWELHLDGAAGAIAAQGQMHVDVALGRHVQVPITVTMPATGTSAYLVLTSSKGGRELFREDAEWFTLQ